MFSAIAHAVANKRTAWIIIAVWLLLFVFSRFAPKAATSTQQQDFLPSSDDSIVANHIANDQAKFPRRGLFQFPLVIIFRDANGLAKDDVAAAKTVSDYLNDPNRRPSVVSGVSSVFAAGGFQPGQPLPNDPRFVSTDGKTMTSSVTTTISALDAIASPMLDIVCHIASYLFSY